MSPVVAGRGRRRGVLRSALVAGASIVLLVVAGLPPSLRAADPSPVSEPSPSASPGSSANGPMQVGAPTAGAASATTILPYQASGYRYQVVAHGGGPAGFETAGFDDASWTSGTAAFGSGGGCSLQSTVATSWPTNTDLLLRRHLSLPAGSSGLTVWLAIDNDATLYWNGTLLGSVSHENCPALDNFSFPVPDGALRAGDNVLAVRAVDRGSESLVDLRVTGQAGSDGPPAEQTLGTGSGLHGPATTHFVAEPVNTATGNYVTTVTDLALPGRGLPFAFSRTYNSLDPTVGSLGPGWRHAHAAALVINADGSATFRAEDGAQYVFAPDGVGGFVAPAGSTDRLTSTPAGYELVRRDQVRYRFDTGGRLTALVDRNGNALTFAYTGANLTTITDTVGRVITLSYDPSGRLASLADPAGRRVAYTYDAAGRLASVTDVRGGTTAYGYDPSGRLATITDQDGHVLVTNTYGPDGRVAEQLDGRGNRSTFAYDPATGTATFTDARGGVWLDVYESNKLVRQVDPLGNTTTFGYDAGFNRTSITDPRGNTTTMTYDAAGNLLTRTAPAPLSYVESFTHDGANNLLTATDGRGFTTANTYDPAGNLLTRTAPDGTVTSFAYDPSGLLLSVTDPRGKTTSFAYDAQANRIRVTSPLGNVTTMAYDPAGQMTSLTEPRGNVAGADPTQYTTRFVYDPAGNLLTVTDPLGNVTTTTYDPTGLRTSLTDALNRTTRYAYDPANHLASVTDALGGLTAYGYDATGNLVSRTDANAHTTAYEYDLAGRLVATVDPLGNRTSQTYDPAGNVATRTDANGATTTFAYDALNRLVSITYANTTTPSVTFAYDPNGNRTAMSDGAGTETSTYDELDRLRTVSRGTDQFAYTFDAAGNLLSRTYPDGTVTSYTYDDDGRMASATSGGAITTYTYDPAGNVLTTTTPDGFTARRTYDRAGRLTEIAHVGAAGTLSQFTYALDRVGNRTKLTTTRETHLYFYDALDRITKVCYGSCPTSGGGVGTSSVTVERPPVTNPPAPADTFTAWTYDPVGNRLTETNYLGQKTYTYDAADRLMSVRLPDGTSTAYTYDNNGNQTGAGPNTFAYDQADRLTRATVGTKTESYTWSGDGVRLSATSGNGPSGTTRFLVDRAFELPQLALERDGNGKLVRRSSYGLDLLAQTTPTKGPYWSHHDGLGSVTDVTSPSGTSLWWMEYTPYGAPRASGSTSQAPTNLFRFTGAYADTVTSLYHLRARQYDPALGRFLSPDPVSPAISDPYVGSYVYVRNNPVNRVDPSGRCWWLVPQGAAVGGAGGAAAGGVGALPGAAGGALVGFVACVASVAAATVAAAVVANSIRDQRVGDVIPPITNAPFVTQPFDPRVPLPGPPGKEPFNPQSPGGKKVLAALAAIFTAVSTLVNPTGTKEPFVDPRVAPRPGIK